MSDVTRILRQIDSGDPSAADRLLPLVYEELRKLAAARLAHESPGQTLQPTALVHEAYVRLVDVDLAQDWDSRGHFFAAAAEAMQRILVEAARRRQSLKRGGEWSRRELADIPDCPATPVVDLVALDEALERLKRVEPQAARLVQLRFFGGVSMSDAAVVLGISERSAARLWTYARAWLYRELAGDTGVPPKNQ